MIPARVYPGATNYAAFGTGDFTLTIGKDGLMGLAEEVHPDQTQGDMAFLLMRTTFSRFRTVALEHTMSLKHSTLFVFAL